MNKTIVIWLLILLVTSGVLAVWSAWKIAVREEVIAGGGSQSVREAPPGIDQPILTEFTLTEQTGQPFGTRDLEGDVWVASFFFSACPGSCRAQNLNVQALQNKFARQGVKFVSITCDPRIDTPERLAEYAAGFQAKPDAWYFLTGDMSYIRRIGAEFFQVFVDERGHLDRFMAVDKWGNVRGYYDWGNPLKLEELGQQLEEMLEESEPPAEPFMPTAQAQSVPHDFDEDDDEQDEDEQDEDEQDEDEQDEEEEEEGVTAEEERQLSP